MKLNRQGKLAKFYMWLPPNDKKLPQDFCTYFWGLIGRAFFIFVMGGFLLTILIFAIVAGAIWVGSFVWAHKAVTLMILGWLLFMALAIWHSERKKKIKIEFLSEAKLIIRGKVDAVKNRYCQRIEWKD